MDLQRPLDVATLDTADFVSGALPAARRIIEVGCGNGDVAAELIRRGYDVTGIEADADSADRARQAGVPVVRCTWPDYDGDTVDAIVFTRSLHHIPALPDAISAARRLLVPGGRLLLEDFDYDSADPGSVRWLMQTLAGRGGDVVHSGGHSLVAALRVAADPLAAWRHDHDHDLHAYDTMRAAIGESFRIIASRAVPYLYRYLVPELPESAEAARWLAGVLGRERESGKRGRIVLIGRRLLAEPA